jgi:hypothetical protein
MRESEMKSLAENIFSTDLFSSPPPAIEDKPQEVLK